MVLSDLLDFLVNLFIFQLKRIFLKVRGQEEILDFAFTLFYSIFVLFSFAFLVTEPFFKGLKVFNIIFFNQINFTDFEFFRLEVKFLEFLCKLLFVFVSVILVEYNQ